MGVSSRRNYTRAFEGRVSVPATVTLVTDRLPSGEEYRLLTFQLSAGHQIPGRYPQSVVPSNWFLVRRHTVARSLIEFGR
jgi:hypothetical protein